MTPITSPARRAPWTLLILAALHGGAIAEPDVLDRPAMMSAKANSSVLLALGQAGPNIVAAGERGIILWSGDAGATWRQSQVPVSVSLTALRFTNEHEGWALGHSGVVLRTSDGGKSWTRQLDGRQAADLVLQAAKAAKLEGRALADAERLVAEGPSKPFLDLHFFDARRGLLVGAFGLLFSTSDGGQTWQPAQHRLDNPKGNHLYAIVGSGEECLIAGEQGAVFRSVDGGKSFATLGTGYDGSYFGAIALAPSATLLFGMRGNVRWTVDGGNTWQKSALPTSASITAGLRLRDASLLLADETGQLYRSTDEGRTFAHIVPPRPSPLTALVQARDGALLLSGVRGISSLTLNHSKVQP